jgi:hypothetical protein
MPDRRKRRDRAPHRALARALAVGLSTLALGLAALTLGACGDTLQDQPIPHNTLEGLLMATNPVYWLGRSFRGMQVTEAGHDVSGAYSIQYGDCLEGGQGTCVPPVRVVTSPDNSFVPGTLAPHQTTQIRGVAAVIAGHGRAIEIATAGVVVGIYAQSAGLASAAAEAMVPINGVGAPGERLAPQLPDTGFTQKPLPGQTPPALRALG